MSNRATLNLCSLHDVKIDLTPVDGTGPFYGLHIYDDYEQDLFLWERGEILAQLVQMDGPDHLKMLRLARKTFASRESGGEPILEGVRVGKNGMSILNEWHDWPEIQAVFEEEIEP